MCAPRFHPPTGIHRPSRAQRRAVCCVHIRLLSLSIIAMSGSLHVSRRDKWILLISIRSNLILLDEDAV